MSVEDQLRNQILRLQGENARLHETIDHAMLEFAETNIEFVDEPFRSEAVRTALAPRDLPFDVVSRVTGMLAYQTARSWERPRMQYLFSLDDDDYWPEATMNEKHILFYAKIIDHNVDPPVPFTNMMLYSREERKEVVTLTRQQQVFDKPVLTDDSKYCMHFSLGGPLYIRSGETLDVLRVQDPVVYGFYTQRDLLCYCTAEAFCWAKLSSGTLRTKARIAFNSPAFIGMAHEGFWIRTRNVTIAISFKEKKITSKPSREIVQIIDTRGVHLSVVKTKDEAGHLICSVVNLKLGSTFRRNIPGETEIIVPVSDEIYATGMIDSGETKIHDVYGHEVELEFTALAAFKGDLLVNTGTRMQIVQPRWRGANIVPLP